MCVVTHLLWYGFRAETGIIVVEEPGEVLVAFIGDFPVKPLPRPLEGDGATKKKQKNVIIKLSLFYREPNNNP